MPVPLEHMDLTESAVYWEIGKTNREGFHKVKSPIQLSVRWEEEQKEIIDANGNKITTDVTIACNRNLEMNSIIWEGTLEHLNGSADLPDTNIYEIVGRIRAKDIKGIVTRYEFGIRRYKDSLPEVE